MDGKSIYLSLSQPPKYALKKIGGGKMKGKSDINPQWRYWAMTETFGLCGEGWYYEIVSKWDRECANGEVLVWIEVALFIKINGEWSKPIFGTGGNKVVALENGKPVPDDEGYKKAETDALSVAMKKIGIGADVYLGRWDGSKYADLKPETTKAQETFTEENPTEPSVDPVKKWKHFGDSPVQLAGGATTPEEKEKLLKLFNAKNDKGEKVFTKEEVEAFKDSRKDKTAAILIDEIEKLVLDRTIPF